MEKNIRKQISRAIFAAVHSETPWKRVPMNNRIIFIRAWMKVWESWKVISSYSRKFSVHWRPIMKSLWYFLVNENYKKKLEKLPIFLKNIFLKLSLNENKKKSEENVKKLSGKSSLNNSFVVNTSSSVSCYVIMSFERRQN